MSFRPNPPTVPPSGEVTEGAAPAIAAPISGDELAARLFAEQGYLVMGFEEPVPLGTILFDRKEHKAPGIHGKCTAALRIVAHSSRDELESQYRLAQGLLGLGEAQDATVTHFYRAEAAD